IIVICDTAIRDLAIAQSSNLAIAQHDEIAIMRYNEMRYCDADRRNIPSQIFLAQYSRKLFHKPRTGYAL
ncbi:hypothetical protein, partial [Actinobacillus pleuropneumoniae]